MTLIFLGGLTIGQSLQVSGDLAVSGPSITLSGSTSGELRSWSTNSNALPAIRGGHRSVTANGYVYVIGGTDGTVQSTVYYAKLNSDGTVGTWNTTTALPAGRTETSAVTANGYIYTLGGSNGSSQTTTYYAKLNSDGTVGTWNTTTALPAGRESHSSVVANGYVYVIGGSGASTTYYAKLNSDGTVGSWSTTSSLAANIQDHSSVVANGYAYVLGGRVGSTYRATAYYAQLNSDGTVGSWTSTTSLPANRAFHTSIINNGYVYVLGGTADGTVIQSTVYYAKLNSNGTVGSWSTNATTLPATRGRFSSILANGYVYAMGGYNGSYQSTVYYASAARVQIGANLDLVGLQGQTLSGPGDFSQGSTGGSITAGNGIFVGSLQVSGQANFSQNVGINGVLSSGNLTITDTSTTSVAQFVGSGSTQCTVVTGTGWSCSSDERLKTNINTIQTDGALNKIMQLEGVTYNWLNDPDGVTQNGFIAQAVQEIFPELVGTDGNGYLTLNKEGLIPYLVASTQEQQKQIDALQGSRDNYVQQEQDINFSLINVSGTATIQTLTVTQAATIANLTVTGDATFNGKVTFNGHIVSGGTEPTVLAASTAGIGSMVNVTGNDTSGVLTVTPGVGAVAGEFATITFSTPYARAPNVVLQPKNASAGNLKQYVTSTASGFTIHIIDLPAGISAFEFYYHVIQ